jgi:tetratricopeptide (TPR) repeat protein
MEPISQSNRLVRSNPGGVRKGSEEDASLMEAAFCIQGVANLHLNKLSCGHKAEEYLFHAVSKAPDDLRSHVQRVNLFLDRKDAEGLQGALLDLFIVLGDKGRPLRKRMLTASRMVLSEEQYRIFAQCLDSGIRATDMLPPSRESVLSKGVTGTNRLVSRIPTGKTAKQDPLEEAQDHLEYGQVEEAMEVLENAILKEPSRPELHPELLEIYRAINARDRFLALRKRLGAYSNQLPDAWQELETYFEWGRLNG